MYKDIHSETKLIDVFGPVAMDADNTPAAIDLKDFRAAELVLGVGIGGITFTSEHRIDFEISHSDNGTDWSAPAAADILGEAALAAGTSTYAIFKSLVAAHAAAASYRFGYVGGKRYIRVLANFSGTHGAATPLYVAVVAQRPAIAPVENDA